MRIMEWIDNEEEKMLMCVISSTWLKDNATKRGFTKKKK